MVQSLTGLASEDDLKTISALRSKTVDEKTISASSKEALARENCGRRGRRVAGFTKEQAVGPTRKEQTR